MLPSTRSRSPYEDGTKPVTVHTDEATEESTMGKLEAVGGKRGRPDRSDARQRGQHLAGAGGQQLGDLPIDRGDVGLEGPPGTGAVAGSSTRNPEALSHLNSRQH
jgi:hypothetical protein